MSDTWTIGELAERAADLLSQERRVHGREPGSGGGPESGAKGREPGSGGPGPRADGPQSRANGPEPRPNGPEPRANGRVREVPNERLIRWYTTIGLLDPPLGRRGRVALYGRRHLLQLVAVKRRQAEGRSIADIQAELAGATDAMLMRVAGLTEPLPGPAPRPLSPPAPPSPPPPHRPAVPAPVSAADRPPGPPSPPAPPAPGWHGASYGANPETDAEPAIPDIARPAARDRFWARPASSAATAGSGHYLTPNKDIAHGDTPHRNSPRRGATRGDALHGNTPHEDIARGDAATVDATPANTGPTETGPLNAGLMNTGLVSTGPMSTGPMSTGPMNAAPLDVVLPDLTFSEVALPDVVHGVRLAPGVTVLLDRAHRVPDGHEVAALRRAAAPLLAALAALGLAGPFESARAPHDASALDPHASDTSDPLEG
ncbi:MerR family transcriptional regulator [Microbispora hainanensis]|uniref:Helix-turn-helix domain-containing protein n=1 Tax=Microbispora hainanensis TaxID=568844 RepID=A0ABZ1STC2_9ACTN|nr:MerR family transcriptional regulator [Microbispora hainanensis]